MRASLVITLLALSLGSASGLVAKPPVEKVEKQSEQSKPEDTATAQDPAKDVIKAAELEKRQADRANRAAERQSRREKAAAEAKQLKEQQLKKAAAEGAAQAKQLEIAAAQHELVKAADQAAHDKLRADRASDRQAKVAAQPIQQAAKGWTDAQANLMKTYESMQNQASKAADQAKAADLKASRDSAQESKRAEKQEKEKNSQISEANAERYLQAVKDSLKAKSNGERTVKNVKHQIANGWQEFGKNLANQYEKASQSLEFQKKQSDRSDKAAAQQSAHEKQQAAQQEREEKRMEMEMQEFTQRNEARTNKKDTVSQKKATDAQHEGQMKNWRQGLEKVLGDQHEVTDILARAKRQAEHNTRDMLEMVPGGLDLYKAGSKAQETAHRQHMKQVHPAKPEKAPKQQQGAEQLMSQLWAPQDAKHVKTEKAAKVKEQQQGAQQFMMPAPVPEKQTKEQKKDLSDWQNIMDKAGERQRDFMKKDALKRLKKQPAPQQSEAEWKQGLPDDLRQVIDKVQATPEFKQVRASHGK